MVKKIIATETMIKIMSYELAAFNDEGVVLSKTTVHDTVLSATDGFGNANSKNIYRASIRWVLATNGYKDVKWPSNWMQWTVEDLATELLN